MATNETIERIVFEGVDKISAASKSAEASTKQLQSVLSTVKDALGAIGVTVGVGAFVKLQLDAIHATAALDDMAESTGASVEKLSAIQRVAKVGGQDFEGLTQQLGRMVKGLKDGSDEGSKAAAAFKFLGVEIKDSSGNFRDTGQVLIEASKSLNKYADDGNKVQLIQDALGKGAERYAPLLKDIAEGTDLVAKTTTEQAAAAEAAEKNINRLTLAMQDSRTEMVKEFTPAIVAYTERVLAAKDATGGLWTAIAQATFSGSVDPLKRLEEINAELREVDAAARKVNAAPGIFGGTTAFLGFAQEHKTGALLAERRYLMTLRDRQMQALGRELAGFEEDASGNLTPKSKVRSGYVSPQGRGAEQDSQREREFVARQLQEGMEEEQRIRSEAAHWTAFYRDKELQTERDFVNARNQALIDAYDREQEEAIAQGEALLAVDNVSYTMKLQLFRQQFADQATLEEEAHAQRLAQLGQFSDAELEALGGRQALIEQLTQEHYLRLLDIEKRAITTRGEWERAGAMQRTRTVFSELEQVTAGVAQRNRTLFQINKVSAIANAIISTHEGVTKTLGTYPWPLAGVMAAIHLAAGLARVAAIQGTEFGTSATAPSVAGTTAAPAVTPVPQSTSAGSRQSVTIHLVGEEGATFSASQVRKLLEQIADLTEDGARVSIA